MVLEVHTRPRRCAHEGHTIYSPSQPLDTALKEGSHEPLCIGDKNSRHDSESVYIINAHRPYMYSPFRQPETKLCYCVRSLHGFFACLSSEVLDGGRRYQFGQRELVVLS